jgi:hypothetical protein
MSSPFEQDKASGQQIHLYQHLFDDEHMYLELTGFPFDAASSVELSGHGPRRISIRLSNDWTMKLGLLEA